MGDTGRLVNEFESYFYDFSPRGFTDGVYNAVIDSWGEAVTIFLNKTDFPNLKDRKKFERDLLGLLFRTKCNFKGILHKFTEFAMRYIFRIPTAVTLPEHKMSQILAVEQVKSQTYYDPGKIEKSFKKKENQIIELRYRLAERESMMKEIDDVLKIVEAIERASERKELELSQLNSTHSSAMST